MTLVPHAHGPGDTLQILAPIRYPWTFNGPRHSRHIIDRRPFLPLNKISAKIEGVTVFRPTPIRKFDLIHAFNRIPVGTTPFIIGFESHLPRGYGLEASRYYNWMLDVLASERCRGVFAISSFAERIFRHFAGDRRQSPVLFSKLAQRYPNLDRPSEPSSPPDDPGFTLVFVGAHFARKGGCVAVRLAELARQAHAPIKVEIISSLEMGGGIWTDPSREDFYARYRELLNADNVVVYGPLSNAEVLATVARSHFSLLTTFADTFGYSALESMANGTPVIGTDQGALPEFITDMDNGILLPLETNALGEWRHAAAPDRDTKRFETMFEDSVEQLAQLTFDRLTSMLEDRVAYQRMRERAYSSTSRFDSMAATRFWDRIYVDAVAS